MAAAKEAISSPLLEASVDGARGVLLNISGGSDLGLFEVNEAAEVIASAAHQDANIIFGAVIDDALGDEVRVTVIAAGFDRTAEQASAENGRPQAAGSAEDESVWPTPGMRRAGDNRVSRPAQAPPASAERRNPTGGSRSGASPSGALVTTAMTTSWTSPPSSSADPLPPEGTLAWRPGPPQPGDPEPPWPPVLVAEDLLEAGIVAAFTGRAGGTSSAPFATLNLALRVEDDLRRVLANRRRVATVLGLAGHPWALARQVHGATILHIRANPPGQDHRSRGPGWGRRDCLGRGRRRGRRRWGTRTGWSPPTRGWCWSC